MSEKRICGETLTEDWIWVSEKPSCLRNWTTDWGFWRVLICEKRFEILRAFGWGNEKVSIR